MTKGIVAAALLCALVLAAPAGARTLRVHDHTLAAGEAVRVSGAGWGTTVGVCAADPVEIRLVRHRRSWRLARLGGLDVTPLTGTFATSVRVPDDVSQGSARIVVTQREHVFHLGRGCVARPLERLDTGVIVFLTPESSCVEPECTPIVPRPRLGIDRIDAPDHRSGAFWYGLPDWTLEAPPPVCDEFPCMRRSAHQRAQHTYPGSRLRLVGDTWEIPEGCPDRVRLTVLDSSGTGHTIGMAAVDEEGRFTALPELPPTGLAVGLGTVFAATDSSSPSCALVASVPIDVRFLNRIVRIVGLPEPGGTVTARGLWWGSDRCDRAVEVVLLGDASAAVLRRVRATQFGAFDVEVKLPAKLPAGAQIGARQERRREAAGVRGAPKRAKCGALAPARSVAARPFPATLVAVHDGGKLQVTGFGWGPESCGGKLNPVSIERAEADRTEPLTTVLPEKDAIRATVPFEEGAKLGTAIRATQPACAGSDEDARIADARTQPPPARTKP